MGGGDFKHWAHVSDGKFVINTNTFTQLFSADGPTADQLFFFLILSPLLCTISSLLSSLCSPSCLRTHPTLTPEILNSPTSHNSHLTSNNSLLCTWVFRSHPPLITLNRSPTSHNSHQTNNFLLCTLIRNPPNPNIQKKSHAPPQ